MNETWSDCNGGAAPSRLTQRLGALGVVAWADAGKLCLSAPEGALGPALLEQLRDAKSALLGWVAGAGADQPHAAQLRPTPEQVMLLRAGSAADYVVSGLFRIEPPASAAAMSAALDAVLARHDAFRACFPRDAESQFLMRLGAATPRVTILDLGELDGPMRAAFMHELLEVEGRRPFDLDSGPLLRVCIIVADGLARATLVAAHHVVMDRWSMDLLGEEITYSLLTAEAGRPWTPDPAPSFAAAVARRCRGLVAAEVKAATDAATEYMHDKAETGVAQRMPRLHRRNALAKRVDRRFPAALQGALKMHGRPSVVLLGALAMLLRRTTSGTRLRIGLPVARRQDTRAQATVGCFTSTVPLVLDMPCGLTAGQHLAGVTRALDRAMSLQDADMAAVHSGAISYGLPPFNVIVSFQSGSRSPARRFNAVPSERSVAKADLVVFVDDCGITFEYPDGVGDPDAIGCMADALPELAERLLERQDVDIDMLDAPPFERAPAAPIMVDPILAWWKLARRRPDAVAVTDWSGETVRALTHGTLAARAACIAAALAQRGVGPDSIVGVLVASPTERLLAVLGILWAGAAYLPVDERWPAQRRQDACRDVRLLLTASDDLQAPVGTPVLTLAQALATTAPLRQPALPACSALSHVLHTSGSTGLPKQVGVERRNLQAFIGWSASYFSPEALARVLAMTPLTFDLSVFEMLAALASGGALVLVDSPLEAVQRIPLCEPSLINTTPSVARELLQTLGSLPAGVTVNLAGEPFGAELAAAIRAGGAIALFNLYGPSETTTYSSACAVDAGLRGAAALGRAIAGTSLRISDPSRRGTGNRWQGELLIGGAGVSRGYLNQPRETAAVFRPDAGGARVYATGDHARFASDGALHFLGRADRQAKRRGVRIELDEVEAALLRHNHVMAAAALFDPDAGGGRIVALVVPAPGASIDIHALKSALPSYMAPDDIHLVAALPQTSSGKLDRNAVDLARLGACQGQPIQTVDEAAVAAIWAAVVEREITDRHARFFEVGGDSLKLMRVIDHLRRRYGAVISPSELLRNPTVAETALLVRKYASAVPITGEF